MMKSFVFIRVKVVAFIWLFIFFYMLIAAISFGSELIKCNFVILFCYLSPHVTELKQTYFKAWWLNTIIKQYYYSDFQKDIKQLL